MPPRAAPALGDPRRKAYRRHVPIRDELIQRTIQQIANLLARLVTGRAGHDITAAELREAEQELDELYLANLGSSRALIHRLGTEDLLGVLRTSGTVHAERAYVLGALLATEGAVVATHHGADDPQALSLRESALDILLEAGAARVGEPDLRERVDDLVRHAPPAGWPAARFERLFRFEHAMGAFARAETALFTWLERVEGMQARLEVADAANAFYDELLTLEDADLAKGDFSRDEVHEGRADLAERFAELLGG